MLLTKKMSKDWRETSSTCWRRPVLLNYAVAESKLDVRSLCLIREALAYSSSLADLAFVMQGLGTYAIARAAPDHVRDFWLSRAANGKAIAAFALTEPNAGSDVCRDSNHRASRR